jgi:pimeloyl-ACP methyl ester carboxylesterase
MPLFLSVPGILALLALVAFVFTMWTARKVEALLPPQGHYGELRIPVSTLYGRDDRILDWRAHGRALAGKVRGARLELVEGGHMLPITNPDATAAFIDMAATARA